MVIVGAGGATSARAISVAIFHIISLPDIQQTLREELNPIVGTLSSNQLPLLRSLEQLPYLTACIKESLRLSCGFVARSARIAPDETLQYHWYSIPAGTPISTSSWFVHYNPDIFPDPSAFRPDRWLEAGASQGTTYDAEAAAAIRVRNRNFVPFGRGARACQGMNLAWAEMYLTLCALLTRFDIQLFNTTLEDVEVRHDWGFAQSRIGSKGVRVRLRLRD